MVGGGYPKIIVQHLQPVDPQGIELPSPCLVTVIVIGVVDVGGFRNCFNLALTSFFARLSVFIRQRNGFGTFPSSSSLGLRIFLSDLCSGRGCS